MKKSPIFWIERVSHRERKRRVLYKIQPLFKSEEKEKWKGMYIYTYIYTRIRITKYVVKDRVLGLISINQGYLRGKKKVVLHRTTNVWWSSLFLQLGQAPFWIGTLPVGSDACGCLRPPYSYYYLFLFSFFFLQNLVIILVKLSRLFFFFSFFFIKLSKEHIINESKLLGSPLDSSTHYKKNQSLYKFHFS